MLPHTFELRVHTSGHVTRHDVAADPWREQAIAKIAAMDRLVAQGKGSTPIPGGGCMDPGGGIAPTVHTARDTAAIVREQLAVRDKFDAQQTGQTAPTKPAPACGFTTTPQWIDLSWATGSPADASWECVDKPWWAWLKGWGLPLGAGLGVGYGIYHLVGFAYIPVPIIAGIVAAFMVGAYLNPSSLP